MIYLLNIEFDKEKEFTNDFYYSILGAFLNLCKDIDNIYEYITRLSFVNIKDTFVIKVWIYKEENYNKLVNYLIQNTWKKISIDGETIILKQLKFDFSIFRKDIEYKDFKKFILYFNSPTYVRVWNVNYVLPEAEKFIFSGFQKLKKYYNFDDINEDEFKNYLQYDLFVWRYNLKTIKIDIKWNKKWWVLWYVTYYLNTKEDDKYKRLLYFVLKWLKFVWMWTGVKLGCWDVNIKFIW